MIIVRQAGVCSTNAKWIAADGHFNVVHGLIFDNGLAKEGDDEGEYNKNEERG